MNRNVSRTNQGDGPQLGKGPAVNTPVEKESLDVASSSSMDSMYAIAYLDETCSDYEGFRCCCSLIH